MNLHKDLAETDWRTTAEHPKLITGAVHVWRVPLRVSSGRPAALAALLSPEETARCARFRFAADRAAFVAARGRLRELAAAYLGQKPAEVRFAYATHGKPFLPGSDLQFNVSHAGDWAVMAFTRKTEIGVDTERIDRNFRVEDLVERFFSRVEIPVILEQADRHRAFFLAWTRKEAVIKARGDGLRLPLHQFGVTTEAEAAVRLLHTDWAPEEFRRWQLHSFTVAEGYPGAVAWLGPAQQLCFLE